MTVRGSHPPWYEGTHPATSPCSVEDTDAVHTRACQVSMRSLKARTATMQRKRACNVQKPLDKRRYCLHANQHRGRSQDLTLHSGVSSSSLTKRMISSSGTRPPAPCHACMERSGSIDNNEYICGQNQHQSAEHPPHLGPCIPGQSCRCQSPLRIQRKKVSDQRRLP